MGEINCDYRAQVDFGEGLVWVRCTLTGDHDRHKCEIDMGKGPRDAPMRYNVFDPEE